LHVSAKSKRYCAEGRGRRAWFEGRPLLDAYPPALQRVLASKQDFAQLEDFNAVKKKRQQGATTAAVAANEHAVGGAHGSDDDEEEEEEEEEEED
jgi:hypothetical protein